METAKHVMRYIFEINLPQAKYNQLTDINEQLNHKN